MKKYLISIVSNILQRMKEIVIMNWVINALIFSLPFSWYMCFQMYKDLKKKDAIIKLQENMLKTNNIIS